MTACHEGRDQVVEVLLEAGADTECINEVRQLHNNSRCRGGSLRMVPTQT